LPFKLNEKNDFKRPLIHSVFFHTGTVAIISLIVWAPWKHLKSKKNVEFEIIESPKVVKSIPRSLPKKIKPPPKQKPKPKPVRKVFGISRKAHTSQDKDAVSVKKGNTIAKDPDNKILKDSDKDLPIPIEEYLITQNVEIEDEFRIPYPPLAKKNSIEGDVVMNLLIDKDGRVKDVQLVKGPGYGLNEAAMEAVYQFKFKPAKVGDDPVAIRTPYIYEFRLDH